VGLVMEEAVVMRASVMEAVVRALVEMEVKLVDGGGGNGGGLGGGGDAGLCARALGSGR